MYLNTSIGRVLHSKADNTLRDSAEKRVSDVFFAMCKAVDSPVSLGAWLRFKYSGLQGLIDLEVSPKDYSSAYSFSRDYQICEYLSKYRGASMDKTAALNEATRRFTTAEERCRETNYHFTLSRIRGFSPRVEAVLYTARRKICAILGDLDKVDLQRYCCWGPGVTFSLKGESATVDNKLCEERLSITEEAVPLFRRLISDDYTWLAARGIDASGPVCLLRSQFDVVHGNRISFVPKNMKTDRSIAIEPTGNMFIQLGYGKYIRRRLRRVGVDLNDQSINQILAKSAWEDEWATVDLSAASDTISKELVYDLLPLNWAFALDACRSKAYLLNGSWHRYEKWSTMGNGYTFELESLLFYSLAQSVVENLGIKCQVCVYGDDILLPSEAMSLLADVFSVCGFSLNFKKTHYDSAFRESCGKHFFQGVDVTPIYQKEVPNVLEEVYRLANRIGRLAYRMGNHTYLDPTYRSGWLAAVRGVTIRHVVPLNAEDDDGLALPYGELEPYFTFHRSDVLDKGCEGVRLPVLSFRPSKRKASSELALLAYYLRFLPDEPFNGRVSVRRRGRYVSRRRRYLVIRDAGWLTY